VWLWIQSGGAFQALSIAFGAGFTVLVSIALGSLVCGKAVKDWPVRFVIGAVILNLVVFLLCCAQVAYPLVFAILGAAISGVWIWRDRPGFSKIRYFDNYILIVVFTIYFVLYYFNSMAPEASPDGAGYHLGFVARYLREHGFHPITWNIYASLSEGAEMLFLFAFAFGKHSAAAMVHLAFLVALVWQMVAYARRAGFPLSGTCAALLVFASPVVGIDASSAYNDVALACVAFTLFYLLQLWEAERSRRLLILIGVTAGFGYAVKYTAFLGVVYAIGFVAWKSRRSRTLQQAGIVAACAAVLVLPWIVKDWLWVQNPFSPFFNHIFPNPYVTSSFESDFRSDLALYDLPSRWMIPWAVTTSGRLAGVLGPVFILAPIALLSFRSREGRQLLLAAAVFGATYFSNIGARFLIAPLPFIALAMLLTLGNGAFGRTAALALVLVHAAVSWPPVVRKYAAPGVWALKGIPFRAALRLDPPEDYLQAHLVYYGIDQMIERITTPGSTVFSYQSIPEAYTSRRILIDYESAGNHHYGLTLWTGFSPAWLPTLRARFTFDRQPLRGVRVVQTSNGGSPWRIHELRLFDGASSVSRNGWQVTADPFPWKIESAFDNKPVTFWECGDKLQAGMYVEADFPGIEQADSVMIEAPPNQPDLHLRLLGEPPGGQWKTLAEEPQMSNAEAPDLRRAAVEELKRQGIGYVLLFDTDVAAGDFRQNLTRWGVREVGQSNGARLYELQ
jgi:Dolichyl-phosphate-mannose-protein mannosyltransferase